MMPITDRPLKRRKNGEGYELVIPVVGRYKKPRVVKGKGVRLHKGFWVATIMAQGVTRIAKFAVGKHGFTSAKRKAHAARQAWVSELVAEPKN